MKKEHVLIVVLLIIILVFGMLIVNLTSNNHNASQINQTREIIANNSTEPGTVEVIKNIGNPGGKKIAYIVGVHPLEYQTHQTLLKILPNISDLNNSYDIYIINVTQDVGHYGDGSSDNSPGRQNGQNLAYKYVYPAILNGHYDLAIDVHSNVGAYEFKTFVFSPVKEGPAGIYASEVSNNSQNISYYAPDSTTSGPYLTVPLNENGIPAFYYEEYSFYPQNVKDSHILELILAVDGLSFS